MGAQSIWWLSAKYSTQHLNCSGRCLLQWSPFANDAPIVANSAFLFEMDDMVGMYSCSETVVSIWVIEDYERPYWSIFLWQRSEGLGFQNWDVTVNAWPFI
jgi:hypothetical protein